MKDISQLLVEKADALRLTNKRVAALVDEVLKENAGKNLEGKLHRLENIEREHKQITAPIRKHNGAGDNANQESFSESGLPTDDKKSHAALVEAAQKAFGFSKEEAERFASPNPTFDTEWGFLLKETK